MLIQLNSNGGNQLFETSKNELIKHIDSINIASVVNKEYYDKKIDKFQKQTIQIANSVYSNKYEVIITSSGSESNCLLIKSLVNSYQCRQQQKPHIISSYQEHQSIDMCLKQLVSENKAELTQIKSDYKGIIDPQDIIDNIKSNTLLITIIHLNNQTGILHHNCINKVGKTLKIINKKRDKNSQIILHSDTVQSFGKYPILMHKNNINAISVSYYKLHGTNKLASLIVDKNIQQLICKSPQINTSLLLSNVHSGTLNLSHIMASLRSLKITQNNRINKNNRFNVLKLLLLQQLSQYFIVSDYTPNIVNTILNNPLQWYLISFSPIGISSDNTLLFTLIRSVKHKKQTQLDGVCGQKTRDFLLTQHIIISNGSSCSATHSDSYVLQSQNIPEKLQQGVIRVSLCDLNIIYDIVSFASSINHYITKIYPKL